MGLSAWGCVPLSAADPLQRISRRGHWVATSTALWFHGQIRPQLAWLSLSWVHGSPAALGVSAEQGAVGRGQEEWGCPDLDRVWAGATVPAASPCRGRWEQLTESQAAIGAGLGFLFVGGRECTCCLVWVRAEIRAAAFGQSWVAV